MRVSIFYDSDSRTTGLAAKRMADLFQENGHSCQLFPIQDTDPLIARRTDLICVGSPVKATLLFFNHRASTAVKEFIEKMPDLIGKKGLVFCTYGLRPGLALGKLAGILEEKGAFVIANFEYSGPEPGDSFKRFAKKWGR
jgi:flavodoxin